MPLFSRKKKQKTSDSAVIAELDEILGYLDDVCRKRVALSCTANKKRFETDILFLEAKTKSMRIQSGETSRIPDDTNVSVGFSLDKTWWTFKTKFVLIDEKPHLLIPKAIVHSERRQSPRTSFSSREQVKVTVLSLSGGHGVFGMAKDISTEGMCMYIDKAMKVAGEKEVPPSPTLFEPGTKLEMVKLNRVPGCPLIETQGVAKRVYRDGKWCFAFQFKLTKAHEAMISRFIEPRVLDFKYTKRSLKRRQEIDAERDAMSGGAGVGVGSAITGTTATPSATPESAGHIASGGPESTAPAAAETAAPVNREPREPVLVVGEELIEKLSFLDGPTSPFEIIPGTSPVTIIKVLTDDKPKLMICGLEFKGRSMLEVLEKVQAMGVGSETSIVVCAEEIPSKDIIKFKMMRIETVLPVPEDDTETFIETLQKEIAKDA